MTQNKKSYCRICGAFCAITVEVEGNKVLAVKGDKDDPETEGFTCPKGRQIPFQMNEQGRLPSHMMRGTTGELKPIGYKQAISQISTKLRGIVREHGPRAVALYIGTQGWFNSGFVPLAQSWMEVLGSPSYYTSLTIDCPAQFTAKARTGQWAGGYHSFKSANVVLMAGRNTLASIHPSVHGGVPGSNPGQRIKEAKKRGMKLIVVDPRKSDLARKADLHLQIKPGEDAVLFAGLLHIILRDGLHDKEFCDQWVDEVAQLHAAVKGFTPEYVARRTEIPTDQLDEAARLFANGPRGTASGGVGTEMSPHAEVAHYLIWALNIICGRFNRADDKIDNPGVVAPAGHWYEGVMPVEDMPPLLSFGTGAQPRVRGLSSVCGEIAYDFRRVCVWAGDGV